MGLQTPIKAYIKAEHTDATAQPTDVYTDKVFYNNDGRQMGIFIPHIDLNMLQFIYGSDLKSINFNKYNKGSATVRYGNYIMFDENLNAYGMGGTVTQYVYDVFTTKGRIIGIKYKNKTILLYPNTGWQITIGELINVFQDYNNKTYETIIGVKIEENCNDSITIFYK